MLHNTCSKGAEYWMLLGIDSPSGRTIHSLLQIPPLEGELGKRPRLMNRIWQKWWYFMSKVQLYKNCSSHFWCSLAYGPPSWITTLGESVCHVVSCPMVKNWKRPPVKHQQGTEALSPTAYEKPRPVDNHVSELGSGSSPQVEPSDEATALLTSLNAEWMDNFSYLF